MNNPTKTQVQTVIDNLKMVEKLADYNCPVDMREGKIYDHPCGSPMCHGGWYAVSKGLNSNYKYEDGANMMAKDLGFENSSNLEEWACLYPEIWGNDAGLAMFCKNKAFSPNEYSSPEFELISLSQIIGWWEGVQSRLKS